MKPVQLLLAVALLGTHVGIRLADAQPAPDAERAPATRWSLMLGGGALAPVGDMREGYQDGLVAGIRIGVRSSVGLGIQLAADYSPLPRRSEASATFDTAYGTAALVPVWTFGRGVLRLQLGAGGGVALEHVSMTASEGAPAVASDVVAAAALVQVGLEVHFTDGGGLVLLGGATRTFGDREYQYAWGLGGLTLEF